MAEAFLFGLVLFLACGLEFLDFPFVAGARLTGLFDRERLLSASESESDALPGLNIAANEENVVEAIGSSNGQTVIRYLSNAWIFGCWKIWSIYVRHSTLPCFRYPIQNLHDLLSLVLRPMCSSFRLVSFRALSY